MKLSGSSERSNGSGGGGGGVASRTAAATTRQQQQQQNSSNNKKHHNVNKKGGSSTTASISRHSSSSSSSSGSRRTSISSALCISIIGLIIFQGIGLVPYSSWLVLFRSAAGDPKMSSSSSNSYVDYYTTMSFLNNMNLIDLSVITQSSTSSTSSTLSSEQQESAQQQSVTASSSPILSASASEKKKNKEEEPRAAQGREPSDVVVVNNKNQESRKEQEEEEKVKLQDPVKKHIVLRWRDGELGDNITAIFDAGPIPAINWPHVEFGIGNAEALHMEENGVNESAVLQLITDMEDSTDNEGNHIFYNNNVIWIGDTGSTVIGWNIWCGKFLERLQNAQQRRIQKNNITMMMKYQNNSTSSSVGDIQQQPELLSITWPVFIVDWTDGSTKQRCTNVENMMGRHQVFYSKRSMVRLRKYDHKKGWVYTGRNMKQDFEREGYKHTPLIVRTDTIQHLQMVLEDQYYNNNNSSVSLFDDISNNTIIPRPIDVTHLWPYGAGLKKVGTIHSELRTKVSMIIDSLGQTNNNNNNNTNSTAAIITLNSTNTNTTNISNTAITSTNLNLNVRSLPILNVYVGLAGNPVRAGRRGVKSAYIEALLRTKIIIVTQRDAWEDHYRLFEALISGAMVLCDRMLTLPGRLQNGTSVIEYTSEHDLIQKIYYYIEHDIERQYIAQNGRYIAMTYHRSWHRMEEVVFGTIITPCYDQDNNSNVGDDDVDVEEEDQEKKMIRCPWIVHANEGIPKTNRQRKQKKRLTRRRRRRSRRLMEISSSSSSRRRSDR